LLANTLANAGKALGEAGRILTVVSGGDESTKIIVASLIHATGFDVFDAGILVGSRRHWQ
jgi:hypothetical protein